MRNDNGDKVNESRDILAEIAAKTKARVATDKAKKSFDEMKAMAERMLVGDFAFEKAIAGKEMSFICEVKKASPSKGLIAADFPYLEIAKSYEAAGAAAISCLTEPDYFMGQDCYLQEIADAVSIPVLRKDFFVDAYMIYQAKVLGASAILILCAILSDTQLAEYFAIANRLGLSAIFEAHDAAEVQRAVACGARVIGVNNRNLKTFALDLQNSIDLRQLVDEHIIFISESGIKTRDHILRLEANGIGAVLVGETLMRAPDKKYALNCLKGRPKIKLCGLSRMEDIEAANDLAIDYIGFVFAKSRRQVTPAMAVTLKAQLNADIQAVGVFVNAPVAEIAALVQTSVIDVVQLHGQEDAAYMQALKQVCPSTPIIKAVSVTPQVDFTQWGDADYFLLDNGAGGTGAAFDWALLPALCIPKPYFIAGGLHAENVAQVLRFAPYGVDVSGGIETNGNKDQAKMKQFVKTIETAREVTA